MRRVNAWWWWVAAGVAATVVYYLLPEDGLAANLFYNAVGLLSALAILIGVRLHRPARPAAWYWFSAGQAASAVGDLVWEYYRYVLHQEPDPSIADVFYLGSYPLLAVGLWMLIRGHRERAALADATMAGAGLGLAFWIFVLHPIAAEHASSPLAWLISTAYPACDALLLAMLARLLMARGGTRSTRMLAMATLLLLVADAAYSIITLHSDSDGEQFAAGWLLSYTLWAAAALHPSMAAPAEPVESRAARLGRSQIALLTGCAMLSPAMLFLPHVGDNAVDRVAIGASSAVLLVLAAARARGLMRQVQQHSAELRQIALHDDLTGLPNRRHFEHSLAEAARTGRARMAFLGLDDFKNVNDELGRPVGDLVLTTLAGRISRAAPGVLVSRLGGDEFALLLPAGDEGDRVVEGLVAVLCAPVEAGGHELLVGASIGLAEAADPVEALRRAEVSMHAAKETGEPYRSWSPALDERAGEHARLGAELQAALHAGHFQVVYQPIVAVPGGRTVAVEALVRWHHPQRGTISPTMFIPVAERNGLIVELGAWVLRTACEQLVGWRAELGPDAPERVSVNVSARQLARPQFPATVAEILATTGLPPQCLTVEVTETAVFGGGQAVTALHELRALGVSIALDDFGTGHSSLGLLHTVPVDVLKVDKSFVDNITEAGRHAVIAQALIQVSEGLGLKAVAEGVETAEQADVLYGLGYRLLQGYHFGRPTATPEFSRAIYPLGA
ncbi:putative bifunctional diguanylate cyclase/phosphodiesterase [Actinoplanes regularis]|uniref:putative bifunctional diguanylate cyclase/phosphodiesterase n=1 Tax=Actinoplanes regularis TaxID=52697 RepID=UPI002556208D|nr:bifunctional diguanylate cyclase/phosphodiesterase [Actinoplanes regularis]